MKRKILLIMALSGILLGCVACSQKNHSEAVNQEEQSNSDFVIEPTTTPELAGDNNQQQDIEQPDQDSEIELNEQKGLAYHSTIKKAGEDIFFLTNNAIYHVNQVTQSMDSLHEATGYNQIQGFSMNRGIIYYIEADWSKQPGITSIYSMNPDGSNQQLLKTVDNIITEINIYEDVLYLQSWDLFICYTINEDGTLGDTTEGGFMPILENLHLEASSYQNLSFGESLNRYNEIWLDNGDGYFTCINPQDGSSKSISSQDESMIAIKRPYIITNAYVDNAYRYSIMNIDTLEKQVLVEGEYSYLDLDENGAYFSSRDQQGRHLYEYITWDGAKQTLFTVETVPGMNSDTAAGVSNFAVMEGKIYYLFAEEDKMYLMSREMNHLSRYERIGAPYKNKNFASYGQIEREQQSYTMSSNPEHTLIDIDYELLVFDGTSEAINKMNAFFKEMKEKAVQLQVEAANRDEEFISLLEGDWGYSYTSYVDNVTPISDRYVCITKSEYIYTGGAHGTPIRLCYVMDLQTGERLLWSDLVANTKEEISKMVGDAFEVMYHQYPDAYDPEAMQYVEDTAGEREDLFYLTEDSIVVYYTPYEIAPYAAGFIDISIPYSQFNLKIDIKNP